MAWPLFYHPLCAPGFRLLCRAVFGVGGARRFVVVCGRAPPSPLFTPSARAGPSRAGGGRDYEPRDYGPREPGHGEMTQAFFDARYCGEDADFGDLAYDLSLHRG